MSNNTQMILCWNKRFMAPYLTQIEHTPERRPYCFCTFGCSTIIDELSVTRVIVYFYNHVDIIKSKKKSAKDTAVHVLCLLLL